MGTARWPSAFITAAIALLVGGVLLLLNQLTPISGWSCVAIGFCFLAVAALMDRSNLAERFAQVRNRAMATAVGPANSSAAPRLENASPTIRPRRSTRCRGSTDGHHRWSRDRGLCMFCGQEMPDSAG
ncbi:MAG: hypothetical protein WAO09_07600 [Candidatus Dormiibacterota bacterium]|jgi:hypothetical protein